ncbi:hypothetical protein LCGC14_2118210, partial [marine sediment metagenome]
MKVQVFLDPLFTGSTNLKFNKMNKALALGPYSPVARPVE